MSHRVKFVIGDLDRRIWLSYGTDYVKNPDSYIHRFIDSYIGRFILS
jgi:hypothetical protein